MSIYLSPQQGIKELVGKLETELRAFANQIQMRPEKMRIDVAYQIPYRAKPTVDKRQKIEVVSLEGEEAVRWVVKAMTDIRLDSGQSARETLRVPGVVAMPAHWIERINEQNALKAEIEQLVSQIPDQYERQIAWKAAATSLSTLQVMRQAWTIEAPETVRFYWDSVPSVKQTTAGEMTASITEQLRKEYGYVPTLDELEDGHSHRKFVVGILELSKLEPDERIAVYRPGKPHIRARVTFIDTFPAVIRPVPTPIIYEIGNPVPSIDPLVDWEPAKDEERPARIRAKIEDEPLVEGLYLYRYLEPYRYAD